MAQALQALNLDSLWPIVANTTTSVLMLNHTKGVYGYSSLCAVSLDSIAGRLACILSHEKSTNGDLPAKSHHITCLLDGWYIKPKLVSLQV